jgi:MFS family permease
MRRDVLLLVASAPLASFAFWLFRAFLPLYIREFERSMTAVGTFLAVRELFAVALGLTGGWLTDRMDRAFLHAAATLVAALGYLVLVLSPTSVGFLFSMLLVMWAVKVTMTTRYSLVVDIVSPNGQDRIFGVVSGLSSAIPIAGGVVGGFLLGLEFRVLFATCIAFTIMAAILRFGVRDPRQPDAGPLPISRSRLQGGRAWLRGPVRGFAVALKLRGTEHSLKAFLAGYILTTLAYGLTVNYYVVYFREILRFEPIRLGLLLSLQSLGYTAGGLGWAWLGRRLSHRQFLIGSSIIHASFTLLLLQVVGLLPVGGLFFLIALIGGMYPPVLQVVLGKLSPADHRGFLFSLQDLGSSLALVIGAVAGGLLWDTFGPRYTILFDAVLTLVATGGFLGIREAELKLGTSGGDAAVETA